jgi:hypothetical protein
MDQLEDRRAELSFGPLCPIPGAAELTRLLGSQGKGLAHVGDCSTHRLTILTDRAGRVQSFRRNLLTEWPSRCQSGLTLHMRSDGRWR